MRPERSVRDSPRLTKMKGVETRMAPAEDGERHAPEADVAFHQAALFHRSGLKILKRP